MEEKRSSQSINISGGQLSNVQFGGQARRDLTANQLQQIGKGTADKILTPREVAALLDQIKALLQESDLLEDDRDKAVRGIETAKEEVQANEPDKEFAAKSLQRATKVLKEAGETVESGTILWQKVKPILETVSPWLGVAAGFLI